MLVIKVFNQKTILIGISTGLKQQQAGSSKINCLLARSLTQSTRQDQKVTSTNKQQYQLIPIARNISFRPCVGGPQRAQNRNLLFSNTSSHFSSAYIDPDLLEEELDTDDHHHNQQQRHHQQQQVVSNDKVNKSDYYRQSFNENLALAVNDERRLVVLLSWLEAKEKHIEKYRQFYLDRGFDVLNVKTSPLDLLLPNKGALKIAHDFIRFLADKQYSNVVLHGFSVGGYMFGRVLLEIERQDPKVKHALLNSIQGIIFDSVVTLEGTCIGVANSITSNKIGAKILEYLLRFYLAVGHNIATRYYVEVSDKVWNDPLKRPTLFLTSQSDNICDHKIVQRLASVWSQLGVETRSKLFDNSPHVQLFQKHNEDYVKEVDSFLKLIKVQ